MKKKETVILRQVEEYDPVLIRKILREGIEELGMQGRARGRVTIKPNVVMAHHKIAPSAYTRPEFLEGLIRALRDTSDTAPDITISEKTGNGLPTSRIFRRAGYYRLARALKVSLQPIEEAKKKTIELKKGRIHQKITTAREITDNDFLVYAPKLKSNILCQGMTGAVKLNIGILLDRERMWNHNFNLDEKIADVLEVGWPALITTDAIEISCGGNQFTQHGRHLGVVIIAANPLAHDAVCAHILNLEPKNINHLRLAHERGYGPLDLEDINVKGDISLEELQRRTKDFDLGYKHVGEVECNFNVLSGKPYCTGGCQGVLLDWLYMIKDRKPSLWNKLPAWTVVAGKYNGDVEADRLMLIGTCTEIRGKVKAGKKRKIRGCPPSHKDLVLWFFLKTGILNPLFRIDLIFDAYVCLFWNWCKRLVRGRL